MILALVIIIAALVVMWAVIGAVRYGTRTIRPEDYEDD